MDYNFSIRLFFFPTCKPEERSAKKISSPSLRSTNHRRGVQIADQSELRHYFNQELWTNSWIKREGTLLRDRNDLKHKSHVIDGLNRADTTRWLLKQLLKNLWKKKKTLNLKLYGKLNWRVKSKTK